MTKFRWLILFGPLILFAGLVVFLLKGLASDPTELDSALINEPVPQFKARDLYETEVTYDQSVLHEGPLLLNVWATWCPTCRAEHEFLNELASRDVPIVGLNYKDDSRERPLIG